MEFYDPWISQYRENGKTVIGLKEISPEIVASYDLVMVTTGHTNVDYEMVQKNAKAIFDTKNVMSMIADRGNIEVL